MVAAFPSASACTGCAVTAWAQTEGKYAASAYNGSGGPGTQVHVPGRSEILITAPNAVNYFRGEYQHKASRWTGSAAEALAGVTGMGALAMAGPPRMVPYRDNPEYAFADRLTELVTANTFVLDVLGMRDRQVDVALGLGPLPTPRCEAVAARMQRMFTARGVRVALENSPFPALAPVTVTAFSQVRLGADALQVSLAAWLRNPEGAAATAELVLNVLRDSLAEAL